MTSHLTYSLSQAHIDDLLREATDRRRVRDAAVGRHSPQPQMLRVPALSLGALRRVISRLGQRPASQVLPAGMGSRQQTNRRASRRVRLGGRECPRNCVGLSERDVHAYDDKHREVPRASECL